MGFASSRTSINEQIMANGNEDKARLSSAGFCLLCNYDACLKIIGKVLGNNCSLMQAEFPSHFVYNIN